MAPRGSKEPEWSNWTWSEKKQKWKSELKDHKGMNLLQPLCNFTEL